MIGVGFGFISKLVDQYFYMSSPIKIDFNIINMKGSLTVCYNCYLYLSGRLGTVSMQRVFIPPLLFNIRLIALVLTNFNKRDTISTSIPYCFQRDFLPFCFFDPHRSITRNYILIQSEGNCSRSAYTSSLNIIPDFFATIVLTVIYCPFDST